MAIFVNYRRSDSQAITGRIDDHLRAEFGDANIYRDIDSIPLGVDFVEHLRRALDGCDLVLAILGRTWVSDRLAQEDDLVRLELETALASGIPIVPVLVEGAGLPPPSDIPASLLPLLRRQALRVDSGSDFKSHLSRLNAGIRSIMAMRSRERAEAEEARRQLEAEQRRRQLEPQAMPQPAMPSRPEMIAPAASRSSPQPNSLPFYPGTAHDDAVNRDLMRRGRPIFLGAIVAIVVVTLGPLGFFSIRSRLAAERSRLAAERSTAAGAQTSPRNPTPGAATPGPAGSVVDSPPNEREAKPAALSPGEQSEPGKDRPSSSAGNSESLTLAQLELVVVQQAKTIRRSCWEPALASRDPGAPSTVHVGVTVVIDPSGGVQSAAAAEPAGYPGLGRCISAMVGKWRFPHASGSTTLTVPFVFASQ